MLFGELFSRNSLIPLNAGGVLHLGVKSGGINKIFTWYGAFSTLSLSVSESTRKDDHQIRDLVGIFLEARTKERHIDTDNGLSYSRCIQRKHTYIHTYIHTYAIHTYILAEYYVLQSLRRLSQISPFLI
jgi:hypothetical protein